jgi:4-amino-4-deoxy-L-arabinose transferase-like glycosyltransferase
MNLTFFIAVALCSFYTITQAADSRARKLHSLLMYAAMGAGTLVKGPIALAIPAMVIFFYLMLTRKWSLLKALHLPLGVLVYFAIVTPWYLWVEARNPGYLRYFLWEEHVLRFVTPRFSRTESWYYFFAVLAVGFLPWTLSLPLTIRSAWQRRLNPANTFLTLWAVLPFVFFSVSNAKLPHYILPIFPALALLTGRAITETVADETRRRWSWLYAPLAIVVSLVLYLVCAILWPHLLAAQIRATVLQKSSAILIYGLSCLLVFGVFINAQLRDRWREQKAAYVSLSVGLALFLGLVGQLVIPASSRRSSKDLAEEAARFINPGDRIVLYDTYLEGLPFYLDIDRPIWLVQSVEKGNVMGSFYVGEQRPVTSAAYGQILFTFEEFAREWKSNTQPLRILIKIKNLQRLTNNVGSAPRLLMSFKDYALVTNR